MSFNGHLDVVFISTEPDIVRHASLIFSAKGPPPREDRGPGAQTPLMRCEIVPPQPGAANANYSVRVDGQEKFISQHRDRVLWFIEGVITDRLTRSLTMYHLFHAGVVKFKGRGILLPGQSGSGKSTTIAGMLYTGAAFMTDEVAVVDESLRAFPFPRVMSLKPGGWGGISAVFNGPATSGLIVPGSDSGVWFIRPPLLVDADTARDGLPIDCIILPVRNPNGVAKLTPIPKSTAITCLMSQSMDMPLWQQKGFDIIVRLTRQADCYSLVVPGVEDTIRALESLPAA